MRRSGVAVAGFALADGLAADPGRFVHVAPAPDRAGRLLIVSVEPSELSPRGMELADVALKAIRQSFATTQGDATHALATAMASANGALLAENRPIATGRWERRISVGATAIALTARDIVVAQCAPSQAILVQDGQVYAFPDVASWSGEYVPQAGATEAGSPLGFSEEIYPQLYASQAAPGDLIALCSTSIGRLLGRDEDATIDLFGGSLLTEDLEGSLDRLERLLVHHDFSEGFAILASIARLPQRARGRPLAPVAVKEPKQRGKPQGDSTPAHFTYAPSLTTTANSDAPVDREPIPDADPPRFEAVRDSLIGIAERSSRARRKPRQKFEARTRALAAPGAMSVSRYREASGLPAEWRANLPLVPGLHVPTRLLAVSLVVFAAIGGTGLAVDRQRDREAHAASALEEVDLALRAALENPVSSVSSVNAAESALDAARQAGASGDALAMRERDLESVRDVAWKVHRLQEVERLGAIPTQYDAQSPRLALGGGTLFLAAGSLFQFDLEERRLITLLERGADVDDVAVGAIHDVSVDGGNVIASDGTATYARNKQGDWQRSVLAVDDVGGLHETLPIVSWAEAAYGLTWDNNIVRFEQTSGGPMAQVWADAIQSPDLALAQDLIIDGKIHVLLQDGRVVTFSRGVQDATTTPFLHPLLTSGTVLAQAPAATSLYILDPGSQIGDNLGRIVRASSSGDTSQILTPLPQPGDLLSEAAAESLAHAQDLAIDELSGQVFWVADGEIWHGTLPVL